MPLRCSLISYCWLLLLPCSHASTTDLFALAWQDLQQLSADEMAGRSPGSAGSSLARQYLTRRYQQLGLQPIGQDYQQAFLFGRKRQGVNLVGYRRGCVYPARYLVVTAHYDHLPARGSKIFNGADDNASGVTALLYLAALTQQQCPVYSYLFVATDAEESHLQGARAFLAQPPVPLAAILFNLNLDMVGRGEAANRLYLAGKRDFPAVKDVLPLAQNAVKLVFAPEGRRSSAAAKNNTDVDWSRASDHAVFRRAGIPYLYIGVGTHAQYHTPDDDWQRIDAGFYQDALQLIRRLQLWLDQLPPELFVQARRAK